MKEPESRKAVLVVLLFGAAVVLGTVFLVVDPISLVFGGRSGPDSPFSEDADPLIAMEEALRNALAEEIGESPDDGPVADDGAGLETVRHTFLTSSVRGTVENARGMPIAAATLSLSSPLPGAIRGALPGGNYRTVAETGPDGAFRVSLPGEGAFRMSVTKEGFAPHFINLVLPGDDLQIVLEEGIVLRGSVKDAETGAPVPDVLVRARRHIQVVEDRTGPDGTFLLPDMPEGLVVVEAFHDEYDVVRLDGIRASRERNDPTLIELRSGAPLRGRVAALETQKPLPGARVVYRLWSWGPGGRDEAVRLETETDEKGEFLFECASRRGFRIEVSAEGYSPGYPEPAEEPRGPEAVMDVFLKKVCTASGRVFDPDGRPIGKARVGMMKAPRPETRGGDIETYEDGRFELGGIEGNVPFSLIAMHPDHAPGQLNGQMVAPGESLDGVEIRLRRPSRIAGLVLGPDGEPFPAARVTLDGIPGALQRYGGILPMTASDDEGRFRFDGLVEGGYTLSAYRDALRSGIETIALQEAEEYEAILNLAQGLTLQGEVRDHEGKPLDDVLVTALEFKRDAAPAGAAMKRPSDTGKTRTGRGAQSGDGRQKTRQPRAEFEQRVKKAIADRPERFSPREYDFIRLLGLSRFRGHARTDESGRFALSGLRPDDNLILSFRCYGFGTEVLADVAPSDGMVSMSLLPRISLAGRVFDYSTSAPVTRFRVEWMPLEGDTRSTEDILKARKGLQGTSRSFQSADGSFHIEGVEPGEILLRVSSRGYRVSEPRRFIASALYGSPYLAFQLERGGVIQGRVVAGNGSPVSSVPVFLREWVKERAGKAGRDGKAGRGKSESRSAGSPEKPRPSKPRGETRRTDANGRFLFTDLDEGTYEIGVGDPSRPFEDPARINLPKGSNKTRNIVLRNLGGFEARVRGKGGISCQAQVALSGGPGNVNLRKTTGNLGIASFSNLLPGRYKLKIDAKGYKSRNQTLSVEEGKELKEEVVLEIRENR